MDLWTVFLNSGEKRALVQKVGINRKCMCRTHWSACNGNFIFFYSYETNLKIDSYFGVYIQYKCSDQGLKSP